MATEQVILTRDKDGVVHALLNSCRHRGAEVCTEAKGNAKAFVCPYHAWTYGNDGRLKAARLMPKDFRREDHGLRKLAVKVAAGLVFISFADQPLDFTESEHLVQATCGQYGWADAKVAYRQSYPIAANWKMAVENYVECYHCGPAHPEYSQSHMLDQPTHEIEGVNALMDARTRALGIDIVQCSPWASSENGHEALRAFRYALRGDVVSASEDGKALAPLMGRFTDYDGGVTSLHFGGTSFMVAYPDHGVIYRFVPTGVDTCEMELIWLVNGSAVEGVDYDLQRLIWLWTVTSDEDKKIIEHTARGVRSKYFVPGPIAPMEENELRYIAWYLKEIARA
jgi:Rieske 2Fe-2S family protein